MFGLNKRYQRHFGKLGRLIRVFSPFALLVIVLATIYIVTSMIRTDSNNDKIGIPPSPSMMPTSNANASIPATPTSLENATVSVMERNNEFDTTPIPQTLPVNAQIQLIGPPPDSSFYLEDPLSTIWTWPLPQESGQQFAVYLITDENEYLAGTVKDPSLGAIGYQLTYFPDDIVNSEGTYLLQIRLQQIRPQIDLVTSVPRTLTFFTSFPR